MQPRGAFICFEGIDGVGKTTQCRLLADYLKDSCTLWSFPNRESVTGRAIHAYLSGECIIEQRALHLLFSANRWECSTAIEACLLSGQHVVVDRYCYSGFAYGVAKGFDESWCRACDVGLPKPDVVYELCATVETGLARNAAASKPRESHDSFSFLQNVQAAYDKCYKYESAWVRLNAEASAETVHHAVVEDFNRVLVKAQKMPIYRVYS